MIQRLLTLRTAIGRALPAISFTLTIVLCFVLSPTIYANAQQWIGGFVRDANGWLMIDCNNCQGGVQSVTAADSSVTVGGTSASPTVKINTAYSNAWSNFQQFDGTTGNCTGYPSTVYGICIGSGNGTTNNIGIALGPQGASGFACSSGCTTSNSAQLCLYGELSTGASGQCAYSDGVYWIIGKLKISNTLVMGANTIQQVAKIGSYSSCSGTTPYTGPTTNNMVCSVTASGNSATWNFGTAYAGTPGCTVSAISTTGAPYITALSATAVTAHTAGATDTAIFHCQGNGGV